MQQPLIVKSKLSMQDLIQADKVSQSIKQAALAAKPCWMVGAYQNTSREDCQLNRIVKFHLTQQQAEALANSLNSQAGHQSENDFLSFSLAKPDAEYFMYDVWEQWEGQHLQ